ncbi:hypothetical protein HZB60_05480 [candidate division KSB1 bacterium]|nr:hypothetical protein [candidate division KSB1 bacterium]
MLPLPALLALVLGGALRIFFVYATPVGTESRPHALSSYNDEIAHVNYVRHLQATGTLPGQVEAIDAPGALAHGQFENYQPPLYYALTAAVGALCGISAPAPLTILGRWLSLLFGLALFFIWFAIARELALSHRAAAWGAIFLALSGPLVRFSTTAGNESLAWLTCGWLILHAIRRAHRPMLANEIARLALILALGFWSKLSIIVLLPLLLVGPLRRRSARELGLVGLAVAFALLLTYQLWARNLRDFGELIPLTSGFGISAWSMPGPDSVIFALRSFVNPWWEFWHGWSDLCFIGPLLLLMLWRLRDLLARLPGVLTLSLLLSFLAFLFLNFQYRQAEARYLFIAWPVFCAGLAADSKQSISAWILLAALLLPYAPLARSLIGG